MIETKGHFLDSMIIFDILYESHRPLHNEALQFQAQFRFGELGIESAVATQSLNIILSACSVMIPIIRNKLFEIKNEWNKMLDNNRGQVFEEIIKELKDNNELKTSRHLDFALAIFDLFISEIIDKDIEYVLELTSSYIDKHIAITRIKVEYIAKLYNIDYIDEHIYINLIKILDKISDENHIFKDNDSWDKTIFNNLMCLSAFGYKTDIVEHGNFTKVNFYTRDTAFNSNFNKFTEKIREMKDKEYFLEHSFDRINFIHNPYKYKV